MFGFGRKPVEAPSGSKDILRSAEYELCLKRIAENNTRITSLESAIENLKLDLANLRGKFAAKLTKMKIEEDTEKKEEEAKDINNGGYIPFG